jgi:hypothetical protein
MPDELGGVGTAVAAGDGAGSGAGTGTPVVESPKPGTGEGAGEGEGIVPSEGTPEGEGTGEGESAGEGDGEGEPGEEGLEADGRRVDLKTREALAALKKVNPDAARRLSDTYHRAQAIIKDVGATTLSEAVNKVRQMAGTLEALGGDEGITGLQTEVEDYRNEIQQFSEGDPALLAQLHEANPESFTTAITNGLELLATKSPDLMDRAILPTMVARLEKAGMYRTVQALANLIKEGKGQEAYDLTAELSDWLTKAKSMAAKQIEMKGQKDPKAEDLDRREQDIASKEQKAYERQISADVNRQNNLVTSKIVEPFFKQLNLKTEGRREFINALNSRIWAAMKTDNGFQRAAKAIMGKGEVERASRFVHAKFAEILPDHFRKLRDAMYPNFTKGGTKIGTPLKKPAGNGKPDGASGQEVRVTAGKTYKRADVDIDGTPQVFLITGRAYLKGTKTPVPYER